MPNYSQQTLLIDADDTLWENNIYFERAIADFTAWLQHPTFTPAQVRERLNAWEHRTIAQSGYGLRSFRRSLTHCCEELKAEPVTDEHQELIRQFTLQIEEHPIELLPGVLDVLPQLSARHKLLLVTKGDPAEQLGKLARSGLEQYFHGTEVLPEKHEQAYRALAEHHRLDHASTWMIGNSPKSDINPALAAGLRAVFLPHAFTWELEHEEIDAAPAGQTLLTLGSFAHLVEYF